MKESVVFCIACANMLYGVLRSILHKTYHKRLGTASMHVTTIMFTHACPRGHSLWLHVAHPQAFVVSIT